MTTEKSVVHCVEQAAVLRAGFPMVSYATRYRSNFENTTASACQPNTLDRSLHRQVLKITTALEVLH